MIKKDSYPVPPIFSFLQRTGEIEEQMMYNTYNMGLGMIVAVHRKMWIRRWQLSKKRENSHM